MSILCSFVIFLIFLIWLTLFYSFYSNLYIVNNIPNYIDRLSSLNDIKNKKENDQVIEQPDFDEIKRNLSLFLTTLHNRFNNFRGTALEGPEIWNEYFLVTKETLLKWDDENKNRYYKNKNDGSIFVSVGTYRDPYCPMTLKSIYSQAKYPEKVFIGLLQQNCFEKQCFTGVLEGCFVDTTGTDVDCYEEFCKSPEAQASNACINNQVRLFNVNESESLGPYLARYLAGKLYQGEQYYLQIDSHSEFTNSWDVKLIHMLDTAEAKKPVISTYPPDSKMNWRDSPGYRICDSEFTLEQIEWQIIRLSPSSPYKESPIPVYAPFVAAGFLFANAQVLRDVPFDPLLPWIFMGEEISMSARLWTSGYDIFSPTINVLNHYYVRRHYPKYWESVNRYFQSPIHNNLVEIVIKRVKYMLNYPELSGHHRHQPPFDPVSSSNLYLIDDSIEISIQLSSAKSIDSTVTYRLSDWSMGRERSLDQYLQMVGLDPINKVSIRNNWCHAGIWPPQAEKYRIKKNI